MQWSEKEMKVEQKKRKKRVDRLDCKEEGTELSIKRKR